MKQLAEKVAKLSQAGLPIPDSFHVITDAYRYFVADNRLQPRILEVLKAVDPAQPAGLEIASQQIGAHFATALIPGEISKAISGATLGGRFIDASRCITSQA